MVDQKRFQMFAIPGKIIGFEKNIHQIYFRWVLASLAILDRLCWVDHKSLTQFILASQDTETGGISDRPGDMPDPFHTIFGLSGLSLLKNDKLDLVDPVFCMTNRVLGKYKFLNY